jgi:uncharacterized cysteine cluster protein YcgN (CxxCxxCC family)
MLSLSGWWRHLRLRLTGKELILTGKCRQCGACCQRLQLEQSRRWLRSRRAFKRLVRDHPEFSRFAISGRDNQGLLVFNCQMLGTDNRCHDYANRPQLCRDFPHKGIFFCGGALPPGCGFTLSEGVPFSRRLEDAQHNKSSES